MFFSGGCLRDYGRVPFYARRSKFLSSPLYCFLTITLPSLCTGSRISFCHGGSVRRFLARLLTFLPPSFRLSPCSDLGVSCCLN